MEKDLVAVAERTDPLRLAGACQRLRIAAAPEQAMADDWDAFTRRELSVAKTFGGMVAINGVLDPLSGETVAAAIHSLSGPTGEQDERTPGQRRADGLTELCRRMLGFTDPPTTGGERPQVNLTMPFSVLTEGPGGGSAEEGELALSDPDRGRAGLGWSSLGRAGAADPVRRHRDQDRPRPRLAAAGRRAGNPGGASRHASRGLRPRPTLSVARLPGPGSLVRCSPPTALEPRRPHRPPQPGHALRLAPHTAPPHPTNPSTPPRRSRRTRSRPRPQRRQHRPRTITRPQSGQGAAGPRAVKRRIHLSAPARQLRCSPQRQGNNTDREAVARDPSRQGAAGPRPEGGKHR